MIKTIVFIIIKRKQYSGNLKYSVLRDRPFNLKGGGYGFLFRSEKKFPTIQELEYFFFCHGKREIDCHYITEILLNVAFNTITSIKTANQRFNEWTIL